MRRYIVPVLFGLVGALILSSLGVWQVQRLAWKEAVLAEIDSRIDAEPARLPEMPEAERDKYLPVEVVGNFTGETLRVLASHKKIGAGHRIIAVLETAFGRVLVDGGMRPIGAPVAPLPDEDITVTGNLHWPDEIDGYTPEPDLEGGLWFARDVPAMAETLGTRPVLIVLRHANLSLPGLTPLPVDSSAIPNDHLGYAITWFSLAFVWLGMTVVLLWRIRRRTL